MSAALADSEVRALKLQYPTSSAAMTPRPFLCERLSQQDRWYQKEDTALMKKLIHTLLQWAGWDMDENFL